MLRSITELVPFGYGTPRAICGYYLGNIGVSKNGNGFDYVIGFFETDSPYAHDGLVMFKRIEKWDRINSNFALIQKIFQKKGWVTGQELINSAKSEHQKETFSKVIERLTARAAEDKILPKQ